MLQTRRYYIVRRSERIKKKKKEVRRKKKNCWEEMRRYQVEKIRKVKMKKRGCKGRNGCRQCIICRCTNFMESYRLINWHTNKIIQILYPTTIERNEKIEMNMTIKILHLLKFSSSVRKM